MIEKVQAYMQQYDMLPANGNIVTGVSGGPDSVCLLLALVRLRSRLGLRLWAVHVNHGIRAEAEEDAAYVQRLCDAWAVPLSVVHADVPALSRQWHVSSEAAGRRVRYDALCEALMEMDAATGGKGAIAVAHNRDDRAETFLFHLLRGTGLDGMAGIRPMRRMEDGIRLIRPLLDIDRAEIEAFLQKEGIAWQTDVTNAQDLYTRNRIRNHLLPYAEEAVCERAREHLAREAQLLMQTADFVNGQVKAALQRCRVREDNVQEGSVAAEALAERIVLSVPGLEREDPYLRQLVIRECMLLTGSGRDLTAAHIEAAVLLAEPKTQSGKYLRLPGGQLAVTRVFDRLVFSRPADRAEGDCKAAEPRKEAGRAAGTQSGGLEADPRGRELMVSEGRLQIPGLGEAEIRIFGSDAVNTEKSGEKAAVLQNIPQKTYTKWFDYDKIIKSAVFRTRRTGDYLTISDRLDRKSIKKYMIEERIPADRRDQLMLLADGSHIIWVPGHRISAAYKVTAKTAVIMEIRIDGKEEP